MARVEIDRIVKSFGPTQVLRDVSLEIHDGEFLTLLGPSGCGKSTLLRIVAGLEHQDSGSIRIDGSSVDHRAPKERDVAMVFQSYALYPYMTVFENMALPLVTRRMSRLQRFPFLGRLMPNNGEARREIKARVVDVARSLAIEPLLARKPAQLSGGQRQRAALGRAMVRDPQVFLMDEPLSNLDAKLRVHMRAELTDLHRRLKATFIYVTHDQSEAMTMSDRVAVMIDGVLLQVAPPGELYANPANLLTAEFVGSPKINIVPAIVASQGTIRALDALLSVETDQAPGTAVRLGIRSECFTIVAPDTAHAFAGRVRLIENMGSDCFLHLVVDGVDLPLIVRTEGTRAAEFRIDMVVHARPDAQRVLLFDARGGRVAVRPAAPKARSHG
jgi:multiple sugar transport system ATP-binding protein